MSEIETFRLEYDAKTGALTEALAKSQVLATATEELIDDINYFANTYDICARATGVYSKAQAAAKFETAGMVTATTEAAAALALEQAALERIGQVVTVASAGAAQGGSAFANAFGKGGRAGMSILYFSQAVEDLQYGFSAIVNNIPLLVMAMGGGGGLAGAISIVAVGINQLSRHWDDLTGLFQEKATETEAERMDRLANSTKRTAAETAELNKHKARQAEIEKLLATPAAGTATAAAGFKKTLAEGGGGDALRALVGALNERTPYHVKTGEAMPAPVDHGAGVAPAWQGTARLAGGIADFARDPFGLMAPQTFTKADADAANQAHQRALEAQAGELLRRAAAGEADAQDRIDDLLKNTAAGKQSTLARASDPNRHKEDEFDPEAEKRRFVAAANQEAEAQEKIAEADRKKAEAWSKFEAEQERIVAETNRMFERELEEVKREAERKRNHNRQLAAHDQAELQRRNLASGGEDLLRDAMARGQQAGIAPGQLDAELKKRVAASLMASGQAGGDQNFASAQAEAMVGGLRKQFTAENQARAFATALAGVVPEAQPKRAPRTVRGRLNAAAARKARRAVAPIRKPRRPPPREATPEEMKAKFTPSAKVRGKAMDLPRFTGPGGFRGAQAEAVAEDYARDAARAFMRARMPGPASMPLLGHGSGPILPEPPTTREKAALDKANALPRFALPGLLAPRAAGEKGTAADGKKLDDLGKQVGALNQTMGRILDQGIRTRTYLS